MIDKRETRDIIIDVQHNNKTVRVERVQQWRAGFDLTWDIVVNDKIEQEGLKAEDCMLYLVKILTL